jgi:sulfur carrier protein ThiS adenylyltransferase
MTATTIAIPDRDLRQRDIVPPQALAKCHATIIGVGAIGRQVALQLAAIGVPWLQLIDFDIVEAVNLAPQGYLEADLGKSKVEATATLCRQFNSQLELVEVRGRYHRSQAEIGDAVFCCVDSIETRRLIWESLRDRVRFWCDGRMSAEVLRVLTVADAPSRKHYPTTLFTAREAFQGACTAKSTIFCANIAAGLMVAQFAKWLRRLPADADLTLNLLAGEWAVASVT